MTVLSIHPPFGGDLPGESIHDNHWTVAGDLREYIDLPGESTNYVVGKALLDNGTHRGATIDPELSCFFAYVAGGRAEAEALRDAVLHEVHRLVLA